MVEKEEGEGEAGGENFSRPPVTRPGGRATTPLRKHEAMHPAPHFRRGGEGVSK